MVLKNLESEVKHSKQKELQMQSEIDRIRSENMSLNEQLLEALTRADNHHRSNRKGAGGLTSSMKQQQTLEI